MAQLHSGTGDNMNDREATVVNGKFQRAGSLCSQADVAGLRNNAIPHRDRLYRTPKNVVRKGQANSLALQFQKQVEGATGGVRNIGGRLFSRPRLPDSLTAVQDWRQLQKFREAAKESQGHTARDGQCEERPQSSLARLPMGLIIARGQQQNVMVCTAYGPVSDFQQVQFS